MDILCEGVAIFVALCMTSQALGDDIYPYYGVHCFCPNGYYCCDNNSKCCPFYVAEWTEWLLKFDIDYYKVLVGAGIVTCIIMFARKPGPGSGSRSGSEASVCPHRNNFINHQHIV